MVTGIGGLVGSQSQQNVQRTNNRLQTAIAQLVSGSRVGRAADDVAALSIATQLQSEVSSLKQASGNIAQASSLAQVADGGAEQIREALDNLRSLAQQAQAPTVSAQDREALNEQFQQLVEEIDRLAQNTTFNGQPLLDGTLSDDNALSLAGLLGAGESAVDGEKLQVENLSTKSLFESISLDILSQDAITGVLVALNAATARVDVARAQIGSFQQELSFAAANIDSAVANQEAARSILQDTDFAVAATESSIANILRNAQIAVQAQGNRLSPAILKLIS